LPVDERGYPVPWFVDWVDGKPDHRIVDSRKLAPALNDKLCWLCGQRIGAFLTFALGPMCSINRTTAEPPNHRDCALFAVRACPFLTRPHARRREAGLPADHIDAAGVMLRRNPGAMALWTTKSFKVWRAGDGVLLTVGEPTEVLWFAEGRAATRAEVEDSIASGLTLLREPAEEEGPEAVAELERMVRAARIYLPSALVANG